METLKRSISGQKAHITVLRGKLSDVLDRNVRSELESLRESLTKAIGKVETLSEQICLLISDEESLAHEITQAGEYSFQVRIDIHILNEAITVALPGVSGISTVPPSRTRGVKLPKLNIKKFDGDFTQWNSFWDIFNASVHKRTDLEGIEKFTYMKSLLEGDALKLIEGFNLEAHYYDEAVQLLKDTYGRETEIKMSFVRNLLQLESPEVNAESLQEFRANFECQIRSLNTMNFTLDEMYTILLYSKLPASISEIIKRKAEDNWLQFDIFKKHLEAEINNLRTFKDKEDSTSPKGQSVSTVSTLVVQNKQNKRSQVTTKTCSLCKLTHLWFRCPNYESRDSKLGRLKELGLCYVCAQKGHTSVKCQRRRCGNGCTYGHNLCLCPKVKGDKGDNKSKGNKGNVKADQNKKTEEVKVTTLTIGSDNKSGQSTNVKYTSVLPTAKILLKGVKGSTVKARGLLDPCAEKTFVRKSLLSKIKYKVRGTITLKLHGYCSSIPDKTYDMVTLYIPYRNNLISVDSIVVDELPDYNKRFSISATLNALKSQRIKLADDEIGRPLDEQSSIELLIGVDNVYNILHPGFKRIGKLVLLPSIFGYVLTGNYRDTTVHDETSVVSILKLATTPVDNYLNYPSVISDIKTSPNEMESLWTMDHLGICETEINNQDKEVLKNFENTVTYLEEEQQYCVSLPWKANHPALPSNFGLALNRLKSLSSKFKQDPEFLNHYERILKEQESRGFIEKVTDKYCKESHYLAHHGVKRDVRTTPVRIVFDCSAKMGINSPSLNDCLWTGPTLTADLLQVLLRFRLYKFACTSDIEKAFLMVQLREDDRNYTRFLWLKNPVDPNSELIIFRFRVVLFGARSSPFLLNATIRKHLSLVAHDEYNLKEGLYVDNLIHTDDSEERLIEFFNVSSNVFEKAHLILKEWISNSSKLQSLVNFKGIAGEIKDVNKMLGLGWDVKADIIQLYGHISTPTIVTKREILRCVSQLFDPLGYMLPVTIRARIFLQDIWRSKFDWDTILPREFADTWNNLHSDLKACFDISFPRQLRFQPNDVTLHIFSDASNKAYGCVAYIVSQGCSTIVAAKARVAPIKNLSVPKLELTAALLGARLAKFIQCTYNSFQFSQIYIWIDSKVTLSWIVSDKPLQVYVRNRVDEIRSLVPNAKFSYVNTRENPSDLLSRGISVNVMAKSSLWWEGPSWLKDDPPFLRMNDLCSEEVDSDCDNTICVDSECDEVRITVTQVRDDLDELLKWDRFSSFRKFVLTMAWMLRFIFNVRKPVSQRRLQDISVRELDVATLHVLRLLQRSTYVKEYESLEKGDKGKCHLINQLNLFLDKRVIRCKGRLEESDLPEAAKFPLLLPKGHQITLILIREAHDAVAHMGMNATVAEMRKHYWVPQIRQGVRNVLRNCITCKRVQGKSYKASVVPPLPDFRVKCKAPFSTTGIDYTGALTVKVGNKQTGKAYIILFTCPVSRAIHLELVNNLSCHSFLLAFRKFCNRRIFPSLILSDNATTFVAAADFLKTIAESREVQEHLLDIKCTWQFIPARAPWFGAIWERLIGLVKSCLKKVLGHALVTFEELSCILIELEAIINDRPLGYDPGDLNQLEVLTPNHLLYGRKLRTFPKEVTLWEELSSDPTVGKGEEVTKRFKYISHICDHLWKRWEREYLSALRETHNNSVRGATWPNIGELVLIHDEGPRAKWKLGKIIRLYPGGDGVVRVVQLKTCMGLINRPVVKLYPLELGSYVEPDENKVVAEGRPVRKTATIATQARKRLIETGQL